MASSKTYIEVRLAREKKLFRSKYQKDMTVRKNKNTQSASQQPSTTAKLISYM